MAKISPGDQDKIVQQLKKQAEAYQEINSGIDNYLKKIREIKMINDTIAANGVIQNKIESEILSLKNSSSSIDKVRLKALNASKTVLEGETKELQEHVDMRKKYTKEANVGKMVTGK